MVFFAFLSNKMIWAIFQYLLAAWFLAAWRPHAPFFLSVSSLYFPQTWREVNIDYIPGELFSLSRILLQMRDMTGLIVALLQQPSEAFHWLFCYKFSWQIYYLLSLLTDAEVSKHILLFTLFDWLCTLTEYPWWLCRLYHTEKPHLSFSYSFYNFSDLARKVFWIRALLMGRSRSCVICQTQQSFE